MTDMEFYRCVQEADAYTDRDAYISDLALSSLWVDGVSRLIASVIL